MLSVPGIRNVTSCHWQISCDAWCMPWVMQVRRAAASPAAQQLLLRITWCCPTCCAAVDRAQLQGATCNRCCSQAHLLCSCCQATVADVQALQLLPAHSCMAPCQLLAQLHQVRGHRPHLQVHGREQVTEAGCQTKRIFQVLASSLPRNPRRRSLSCLDHLCCQ